MAHQDCPHNPLLLLMLVTHPDLAGRVGVNVSLSLLPISSSQIPEAETERSAPWKGS